ncbi:TRAFAC clade GTPase domain-containing protein [Tautonia plasticadhaerens]|uniref:Double-GTPase 2 domain-containing protein n=1 Tax=Tautonia plasticadhaerens TaxID=2527974 RepID=A0A518H4R4_9BACT|nr:hypothetical protein [Tautonia plasticadhaerens]QDV35807.1 hypothetical protein ElP_37150 [Tautonia plasticadhaerens]
MYTTSNYLDESPYRTNQITCPFCGGGVRGAACGQCHAPMEVVQSIGGRPVPPRVVGVLGPSGVGKTVYLGILLDLLSHGVGSLHGVARGPFSLNLQRQVMFAMQQQRFPDKTPVEADRWQWVHCEVTTSQAKKGTTGFDLVTPDVAGEAVAAELESPGSHKTVRSIIARCSGLAVLIDTVGVIAEGQAQEFFAMSLISYLESLHQGRRGKVELPVALIFTKVDLCDEPIADADAFARSHAPALWRMCEAKLRHARFFCSSVAGSCGRIIDQDGGESLVPLRVEPKGVIEPFAWMAGLLR